MSKSSNTSSALTLDSSNPLYLHPSDHPGMILVAKSFDGTGFGAWKRAMTIALLAKNKLSFVNGISITPTNPSFLAQWQRCNDTVISWILNTLSGDISASVLYTETAHNLWVELNDRYGQVNGSGDIATYFTKIKAIWDELNALNSIPPCSCGVSHLLAKREEVQRLVQFLMGLNSSYDSIRGNILMMKPLPSISEAYAILIQDENQREIHSTNIFSTESSSMNANSRNSYSRFENMKSEVCTHCKKSGHTSNKCYRLVGFPKDFKFIKTKRFSANNASSEADVTEQKEQAPLGLTSEQIGDLLQLLQKSYS
ncbi:uncharacterized protein LOC143577487 [Bidens hawaiensis]|uniref:uncharacterized protein LOC143577487 n=1 Tax=Bidens hawaiensis TaxID=980011 RepID=UPI0040498B02